MILVKDNRPEEISDILTEMGLQSSIVLTKRARNESLLVMLITFSEELQEEVADKEDLDLANHLAGHQRRYLKLKFNNVADLMEVRKQLMPLIEANQSKLEKGGAYQLGSDTDAPTTTSSRASSSSSSSSTKAVKAVDAGGGFIGCGSGVKADQVSHLSFLRQSCVSISVCSNAFTPHFSRVLRVSSRARRTSWSS